MLLFDVKTEKTQNIKANTAKNLTEQSGSEYINAVFVLFWSNHTEFSAAFLSRTNFSFVYQQENIVIKIIITMKTDPIILHC